MRSSLLRSTLINESQKTAADQRIRSDKSCTEEVPTLQANNQAVDLADHFRYVLHKSNNMSRDIPGVKLWWELLAWLVRRLCISVEKG